MIIVHMGTEGPIYRGSCPMEKGMGGYGDMGILKVMLDALSRDALDSFVTLIKNNCATEISRSHAKRPGPQRHLRST